MARSIQSLLDSILAAVYGEQVRTAIHDSIETCYDDVQAGVTLADEAAANATEAYQTANAILGDVSEYIEENVTVAGAIAATQNVIDQWTGGDEEQGLRAAIQTAISNATTATSSANTATGNANTAASGANTATTAANTAASNANTATTAAQAIIARWNGTDGQTALSTTISNAISDANDAAEAANSAADNTEDAISAAETVTESAQAIVDRWNGDDGETGLSDIIQSAISDIEDATDGAQAIIDRWNGDDGQEALSTQMSTALSDVTSKTSDYQTLKDQVTQAKNEANTQATAAQAAALQANSDASYANGAAQACENVMNTATGAIDSANNAATNANSAASLLQNMKLVSNPVDSATASSAVLETISDAEVPYFRLTLNLSKGVKGDSMVIKGQAYESKDDLPNTAQVGDMYNVGIAPPYDVYRWTGSYWENQGPIGFTIENLTDTDIDDIWEGDYTAGSSSKYIDDVGLVDLVFNKIVTALNGKVNVDGNKVLSTNDFTNAYKALLADSSTPGSIQASISSLDNRKVEKVTGKGLSTNDYTTAEKALVATIQNKVAKSDVESALDANSNNPVRNSTITTAINTLTAATPLVTDIAPAYDNSATYNVGDYCTYNRILYRCRTQIVSAESFNIEHWTAVTAAGEIKSVKSTADAASATAGGLSGRLTTAEGNITTLQTGLSTANTNIGTLQTGVATAVANFAAPYSTSRFYEAGDYCTYNNVFYKCKTDFSSSQATFDPTYWDAVSVDSVIGNIDFSAIEQQINTVSGNVTSLGTSVTALETDAIVVEFPSFSSLPQTASHASITADHYVLSSTLGTPTAQASEWTVTTAAGSVTVTGTMADSSSTTLRLILGKARTTVTQATT